MEHLYPQNAKVISALVEFTQEAFFQEQIQDLQKDAQDLFELLLETEQSNELSTRLKMLKCLKTIRALTNALEPFTKEQVDDACSYYLKK